MNSAIIVAAGSGTRFGSDIPKQFLEINGKPMISHSIAAFENATEIHEIVLVVSESELERAEKLRPKFSSGKLVSVIPGGRMRAESVRNGFAAVSSADVVAVHDAARPLVQPYEIDRVVRHAVETGAACLTLPVTDTIKEIEGDIIKRTIDRNHLRRAATPQAFRYDILEKALANDNLDVGATDECYLVEKLGYNIAFVDGSVQNIKITYPEDFMIAEAIIRSRT
jgi:2-C-methyl-D-erythritol 4-phosphate cytidylyltransferase